MGFHDVVFLSSSAGFYIFLINCDRGHGLGITTCLKIVVLIFREMLLKCFISSKSFFCQLTFKEITRL